MNMRSATGLLGASTQAVRLVGTGAESTVKLDTEVRAKVAAGLRAASAGPRAPPIGYS